MQDYELHRTRTSSDCWKVGLSTEGEEASRLWVFIKTMRIGSTSVRIGGIGGVGTNKDHRLKGYASLIMDESTSMMEDKKCDMGFLFGIQNFYDRFGYGVCFADSMIHVKTTDLPLARSNFRTRAYKVSDARNVRRIYNRLNLIRSAAVVRPSSWTQFAIAADFKPHGRAIVALDASNRIVGYAAFRIEDRRCTVHEISGQKYDAYFALVTTLARRAQRGDCEKVVFHVPVDGPFSDFCTRFGYRSENLRPRNSGPMARIIRLAPLVQKLIPELNLRLQNHHSTPIDALILDTDIGSLGLSIENSSIRLHSSRSAVRIRIPQLVLTQLILGYRSVEDVANDPGVTIPSSCRSLLQSLFPKHNAYMWWSDRF